MSHGDSGASSNPNEAAGSSSQTTGTSTQATGSSTGHLSAEQIRVRAQFLQDLVDQAVAGDVPTEDFVGTLQANGVRPDEVEDCVSQVEARLTRQRDKRTETRPQVSGSAAGPSAQEPVQTSEHDGNGPSQAQAEPDLPPPFTEANADALAWRLLTARVNALRGQDAVAPSSSHPEEAFLTALASLLSGSSDSSQRSQPSGIPAVVLSGAPHLSRPIGTVSDPHVAETWRLRNLYAVESAAKPLIDWAQQQNLEVPLPRGIWKDILQDDFVNFEKLHAAMDPGYHHDDEVKELAGGLAIVRKDHSSAKKPLRSEGDWGRVFDAWMDGVRLLFPHRADELLEYKRIIRELFRLVADPLVAVQVDFGIRDSYAKARFRLDDRNRQAVFISTQIARGAVRGVKRAQAASPTGATSPPSKRLASICRNWNLNVCPIDPCIYRRRHGACAECGGPHKAVDEPSCRASFQNKLGKRST